TTQGDAAAARAGACRDRRRTMVSESVSYGAEAYVVRLPPNIGADLIGVGLRRGSADLGARPGGASDCATGRVASPRHRAAGGAPWLGDRRPAEYHVRQHGRAYPGHCDPVFWQD